MIFPAFDCRAPVPLFRLQGTWILSTTCLVVPEHEAEHVEASSVQICTKTYSRTFTAVRLVAKENNVAKEKLYYFGKNDSLIHSVGSNR